MLLAIAYLAVAAAFYLAVALRAPVEEPSAFALATVPCEVYELFPAAEATRKVA